MPPTKSTVLFVLALVSQASAWGTLGHDTVAFVAQSFLSAKTVTYTQSILGDTSSAYLANVATWADTYRSTSEGAFSAPLHYIDALDSPPTSCDVNYSRDCPEEGCVVSAIANYTTRLQDTRVSTVERQKALKWLIHFLGDIHQPLHVENLAIGGNSISVTFDGKKTNLHAVWDSNMAEKLIGGYSLADAKSWSATLVTDIKTGKYATASKSWLTGMNIKDGVSSAMLWANDANNYICSTVLPKGQSGVAGKELDGAYYTTSIPVIQIQIAKAGYRLAAWLNLIATGTTGLGAVSYRQEMDVEHMKREDVTFEDWMVEARRARRAFGWNCGPEGHSH